MRHNSAAEPRLLALDGLRGIAILLVMAQHLRWLGCGWIGVQLFFVLSGFLITRLLVRSAEARPLGSYLKDFYARRALRILPLYFGYLVALAIAARLLADFPPIDHALPWAATFTFNVFRLTPAYGALGAGSERHVLIDHFWSLAVEEHFYLVWPLVLFALRRHLRALALCLIALGPVLRGAVAILWPQLPPESVSGSAAAANYLLSTSHVDAFAAGALVATLPMAPASLQVRRYGWSLAAVVGLAILLGTWVNAGLLDPVRWPRSFGFPLMMPNALQHVWGYSLINLVAAATIWLALGAAGWQRALSSGWLRYTGKISFGMYVLHYPMRQLLPPLFGWTSTFAGWASLLLAEAIYLALVYAVAGLSFRYFERPFLELKQCLPSTARSRDTAVPG